MLETLMGAIPTLGFPIVVVIALGIFIYMIYTDTTKENHENMLALHEASKEREDKLFEEIAENRKINGKFAEIISKHEEKLDSIQQDVREIKTDITILKAHSD